MQALPKFLRLLGLGQSISVGIKLDSKFCIVKALFMSLHVTNEYLRDLILIHHYSSDLHSQNLVYSFSR